LELIFCLDRFRRSLALTTAEFAQVRLRIRDVREGRVDLFNKLDGVFRVSLKGLAKHFDLSSKLIGAGFDGHTRAMEALWEQSPLTLHSSKSGCELFSGRRELSALD
jgi:hypothetical protein